MGYTLHPSLKRALPPAEPKIAEIATGTGAFLVDLSRELPASSTLDGYDISDDAFLSPRDLPANVSLRVRDAKEGVPEALRGRYDVVCVRMMNAGMVPGEWSKVASHAAELLKVGGGLQWIEGDLLQVRTIVRTEAEAKTEALEKWGGQAVEGLEHWRWPVEHLRDVIEGAGFVGVRRQATSLDRVAERRKEGSLTIGIGALYGMLKSQIRRKVEGAPTEEELEGIREEMVREVESGAYIRTDMYVFMGTKA